MTHLFDGTWIDIPAIVLVSLLILGAFVMWKAQQQTGFNFADMLQDTDGKPSAMRLAVFVCLAVSSWVMIKLTMSGIDPKILFDFFLAYAAIWSGAKIVERLLDVLMAKYGGTSK